MSALHLIAPIDVGERLRVARDDANITQKDAAEKINIARTTLVAIEKGQRLVRIDEVRRLAKLYGTSVNALLRQESVHVDLAPRFRKLATSGDAAEAACIISLLWGEQVAVQALPAEFA